MMTVVLCWTDRLCFSFSWSCFDLVYQSSVTLAQYPVLIALHSETPVVS